MRSWDVRAARAAASSAGDNVFASFNMKEDTDLWRTLPAVKLSYNYLRINELHLPIIHNSTLLRDAVGELLRAAARLGRLRWLLTLRQPTNHDGIPGCSGDGMLAYTPLRYDLLVSSEDVKAAGQGFARVVLQE
jgi:hypothetical protein